MTATQSCGTDFGSRYDTLILDPVMRRYYGATGFYNTGYWTPETPSQAEASLALVKRLLSFAPASPADVLDVACGLGDTTVALSKIWPAARIVGINLSSKQLGIAAARAPRCAFHVMDAARMTFADESFELVFCLEATFHFRTRAQFFSHAYRVLRPGGRLILSDIVFASSSWAGGWTVPVENAVADTDEYLALLRENGFVNVVLEDAKEACWSSYCRALRRWLDQERQSGRIDERTWSSWEPVITSIAEDTVRHYLLIAAERPPR
jgi:MPBQ/MSBQ methyltransferase